MYLKSIRAFGFKSFADKTELEIKKGITGVVGPNGSGKSNIVDAIKWVLGEQSIKSLRGSDKMTDVIFTGSKTRAGQKRAMVSLTFDNSDHYLNSEFNEVEVKRVVYHTGENEYYLNNSKVRLKDITDLFIDTGAGKESFNIISQGAVADIINNKPEERRVIFEEAAGVLKYKKRKDESIRKLERTHENLERVEMLIEEIANTIEPLKEEAQKARVYLNYKEELKDIEIALIAQDIYNINEEYQIIKDKSELLSDEILNMDSNTTDNTSKIEQLKLTNIKLDEEISKMNDEILRLSDELSKLSSAKQVTTERKKYEVEDMKLQNTIVSLKEEELTLKNNIKIIEKDINTLTKQLQSKQDDKNKQDSLINNENMQKQENEKNYNEKYKELCETKNRIDILENNIETDAKLPYAVKSLLNNPRLKGIHNSISKVIDTKEEYVTAIETSLGASLNVIIVDNEKYAKDAINYLKENKLGRAIFFPLNIIKGKSIDEDTLNKIKNEDGFIDIASNLVTNKSEYDNIINNQLGNVIVVDNIDSLNKIGKVINYKYRIVTLEGEVQFTGGSLAGGTVKNNNGLLNDKYELENLKNKYKNLNDEVNKLQDIINKSNEKINNLTIVNNEFIKDIVDLTEQINRKNISLLESKSSYDAKTNELQGIKNLKDNKLDEELAKILEEYYEKENKKEIVEKDLQQLKNQKSDLVNEISELELDYRKNNQEYLKKQNELKTCEVKLGKMDVKLDNLLLTLNETYNMTYEKAKENYSLDIEEESARLTVNKIKANIRELGEVNTGAISEFERLDERYTFLTNQKEDLEKSVDSLLNVISEMDEIMKDRFRETFEKIRDEFQVVFKTLFKGGEGILKLTDPDNILETGIDIIAQPPGKKLNSIVLLSGGEKTLTAIALLFAILNIKPVPFVVLDEVEAALDEANVDGFGKYLQSKKDRSQFILITHKKRTMEYADVLYGITMQESGVSKLVSVELEN